MRRWWILLVPLAASVAAGQDAPTVRDEASNFEVSLPPGKEGDWDKVTPPADRKDVKAHFRTEFADTEPLATAEVQILVVPLKSAFAGMALESLAAQWSTAMEGALTNPRDLKEGKATLGGQEAYFRDVQGDYISGIGQVTWHVARMGKSIYVFHVIRTFRAVGDSSLEEEIGKIRDSFKFLRVEAVKADPKAKGGDPQGPAGAGGGGTAKGPDAPDPEKIKREEIKETFWRFQCVKPEGLLKIDPEKFDESEKTNHVVQRFERTEGQTRIVIRIYAQSSKTQQFTIEQLADRSVKSYESTYKEGSRKPPEIDNDYGKKFPLAEKAIRMKLVGRRTVPEITHWYFAQCKNERQYQIQIYITGATGEAFWKSQVDDFLKGFKPLKD